MLAKTEKDILIFHTECNHKAATTKINELSAIGANYTLRVIFNDDGDYCEIAVFPQTIEDRILIQLLVQNYENN